MKKIVHIISIFFLTGLLALSQTVYAADRLIKAEGIIERIERKQKMLLTVNDKKLAISRNLKVKNAPEGFRVSDLSKGDFIEYSYKLTNKKAGRIHSISLRPL